MSSNNSGQRALSCQPFETLVNEGFWWCLSSLKLDTLRTDDMPIPITGFYAPCSYAQISKPLMLLTESLPAELQEQSLPVSAHGDRNKCPVPGVLVNTNTIESFKGIDRDSLLQKESQKILGNILSGKVEDDCRELSRFLVISFADLKKWGFHYWFAFPALSLDHHATLLKLQPAKDVLSPEEAKSLTAACNEWRKTEDAPFFLVIITSDSHATVRQLKEWRSYHDRGQKMIFGFYDPCHRPNRPGWPLQNYLAFINLRCNIDRVQFLCYREKRGLADLGSSLIGEAEVSLPQAWRDANYLPEVKGWDGNVSRFIDLAESMSPERLAVSAADLNLKLMRWRSFPSLDLNSLSSVRCLLLGAGTLGCQVARLLMAWGVRKITLVDSGRVSMSNPVRQSLYTFEDCLNGGELKAIAAARSLKCIFPAVEAEGVELAIPMPGHPVPADDVPTLHETCIRFQELISSHDVVFLLTDTRESRWLPTLICADQNKIAITAALGFDSYLVMRHGPGPLVSVSEKTIISSTNDETMTSLVAGIGSLGMTAAQRLGCYFCNDVVAPVDSTTNRTLDQQCTVTRPGLAPIASALAVELLVGLLHHPNRILAPGEIANSIMSSSEQPLGILPHQIRGLLPQYSQMTLIGHSSNSCTACSEIVVSEYRRRGMDFVIQAINHPTYLEDLTGLTELKKSANCFDVDWDNEDGDECFDI